MRKVTTTALSRDPGILYAAALERIREAESPLGSQSWALGVYVSGLAVETLLQAFALRIGAPHDVGHDLGRWLQKCPAALIDAASDTARGEWSRLTTVWRNDMRYWSADALLGHIRGLGGHRRIKTGHDPRTSILKANAHQILDAARTIHYKGLSLWPSL